MGPKRSSKKENAAPAVINQGAPFEWQQANEALVLYQRGKRDKAIRELDELLASRPSGAACLARAKIWVSQAVDVGLKVRSPKFVPSRHHLSSIYSPRCHQYATQPPAASMLLDCCLLSHGRRGWAISPYHHWPKREPFLCPQT